MQYQINSSIIKAETIANRPDIISLQDNASDDLSSYIHVNADSEWNNFLSLIKEGR